MEDIISGKKQLRQCMKAKRQAMSMTDVFSKSSLIMEQLVTIPEYKRAEKIYTYVSMGREVDTIMLIDYSLSMEKRVFVPKVDGKELKFYEISDISELSPGYMGIFEPDNNGKEQDYSRTGLICLPGLAFDKKYNRLGYGGGFFDRYLAGENRLYKVALAYAFQVVDNIAAQETDVKADMIITETDIYRHLEY